MPRDPRAYPWYVRNACGQILRFTHDLAFEAYVGNDTARSAVERQFEIIGEALSQLAKADATIASRGPSIDGSSRFGTC
jgi:uncharacterized protein with HEPN domain